MLTAALTAITAAVVGVILNLALWFALHTLFGSVSEVRFGPLTFDAPRLATIDIAALLLTAAAMVAALRYRVGPLPLLSASGLAGLSYWLVSGAAH